MLLTTRSAAVGVGNLMWNIDISADKIFLFKLFFLGFFSVCVPNIYFNILAYLSTLDLLSFDKNDL